MPCIKRLLKYLGMLKPEVLIPDAPFCSLVFSVLLKSVCSGLLACLFLEPVPPTPELSEALHTWCAERSAAVLVSS